MCRMKLVGFYTVVKWNYFLTKPEWFATSGVVHLTKKPEELTSFKSLLEALTVYLLGYV